MYIGISYLTPDQEAQERKRASAPTRPIAIIRDDDNAVVEAARYSQIHHSLFTIH